MTNQTTLALPYPRLSEGRFGSVCAFTDEGLYDACGVRIAFTERAGGAGSPPFDTLNLGTHVEDDPRTVARNVETAARCLGAEGAAIICPKQVHGSRVVRCEGRQCAAVCDEDAKRGADAVVVTCENVAALLCFADCVPLIAVAPGGAFSVIHAGWRGVVGEVWAAAVRDLCAATGARPADLNVYIGPHIRACHFEVGPDVARTFADRFGQACLEGEGHVNMAAALTVGLTQLGVDASRMCDVGVCTVCDGGKRFFSYRATHGECGRHGAFAVKMSEEG